MKYELLVNNFKEFLNLCLEWYNWEDTIGMFAIKHLVEKPFCKPENLKLLTQKYNLPHSVSTYNTNYEIICKYTFMSSS